MITEYLVGRWMLKRKLRGRTTPLSRPEQADLIIAQYTFNNAMCGLLPIPALDLVVFTGMQLGMVSALAKLYEVPFEKEKARSLIVALTTSLGSMTAAARIGASVVKFVPILGLVTLPALAGAVTYAVGRVFLMHFEAGGTLLDLDPQAMKEYFAQCYREGLER